MPARISLFCGSGLLPEDGAAVTNVKNRAGRCVTIPGALKTTHYRVTDNEKFRL